MSEQHGMRHWRGFVAALNAAGFDVLITDPRGNGISDGVAGFNTAEQATTCSANSIRWRRATACGC